MRARASSRPCVQARKQAQQPAPNPAPAPALSLPGAVRPALLSPLHPQPRARSGPARSKTQFIPHNLPRPPPTPAASSNARYRNCLGPAAVPAQLPPRQFRSTIARFRQLTAAVRAAVAFVPPADRSARRWRSPGSGGANCPGSSAGARSGIPASRRHVGDLPHAGSAGTTGGRSCTVSSGPLAW